ncbi:hypothetical protein [Arthrobacter sp. R4-81]
MTEEDTQFEEFTKKYLADARVHGYTHFNTEHLEDKEECRADN